MNRPFLLLLTVCLFVNLLPSHAQLYFGPKIGANLSTFSYNWEKEDSEPKTTLSVHPVLGFMVNYKISKKVFLQPELLYTIKGGRTDAASVNSKSSLASGNINTRIHYFEIPINVGYEKKIGYKKGYASVFAGPYVGVAHYAQDRNNYTIQEKGQEVKIDNTSYYIFTGNLTQEKWEKAPDKTPIRRLDYGINIGAGYIYKNFYVNVAYQYGLANLAPNQKYGPFDFKASDFKTYNRNFQISLTYLFDAEMNERRR